MPRETDYQDGDPPPTRKRSRPRYDPDPTPIRSRRPGGGAYSILGPVVAFGPWVAFAAFFAAWQCVNLARIDPDVPKLQLGAIVLACYWVGGAGELLGLVGGGVGWAALGAKRGVAWFRVAFVSALLCPVLAFGTVTLILPMLALAP